MMFSFHLVAVWFLKYLSFYPAILQFRKASEVDYLLFTLSCRAEFMIHIFDTNHIVY